MFTKTGYVAKKLYLPCSVYSGQFLIASVLTVKNTCITEHMFV